MVSRVRCANCRSAVAVTVVWAARDTCPNCLAPLPAGKIRREPPTDPQLRRGTGAPQGVDAAGAEPDAGAHAKHLAAVARTLRWADESAARGDYADALRWVETIEALGDPLPPNLRAGGHWFDPGWMPWKGPASSGSFARLSAALRMREMGAHRVYGPDSACRIARGRPVMAEHLQPTTRCRLDEAVRDERSYGFPSSHPMMHSFLGAPIVIGGKPCGNVYLSGRQDGTFEEADEQMVPTIAEHVARAVEATRRDRPPARDAPS